MADIRDLINKAIDLAKTVAPLVPVVGAAGGVAEKVVDILDGLGDDIPADQQEAAQAARRELADAVRAKAQATSDRLRG